MYKFTVKHGDSQLPDFLNGVRRDVLSIKWHVSGLGLRKPNTSGKNTNFFFSAHRRTTERHTHRYPPATPSPRLNRWATVPARSTAWRPAKLIGNPGSPSLVHLAVRAAKSVSAQPAGSRHRGNKVSLRQGGSFETRTQRRTQAPSCGGEHQWWRVSAEVLFMKYSSYYKRLGFKLYSGFYYDI